MDEDLFDGPEPERECVLAEDLAAVIAPEIERRRRIFEAHQKQTGPGTGGTNPVGVLTQIEQETGLTERAVFRILSGETISVDLGIADRLCLALDMNISLVLPEEAFLPERIVREATMMQTELLFAQARRRGIAIPAKGTSARRTFPGQYRRRLQKEQRAAA